MKGGYTSRLQPNYIPLGQCFSGGASHLEKEFQREGGGEKKKKKRDTIRGNRNLVSTFCYLSLEWEFGDFLYSRGVHGFFVWHFHPPENHQDQHQEKEEKASAITENASVHWARIIHLHELLGCRVTRDGSQDRAGSCSHTATLIQHRECGHDLFSYVNVSDFSEGTLPGQWFSACSCSKNIRSVCPFWDNFTLGF